MAETWYAMVVLEGSLVSLQISCQARHVEEVSELAVIGRGIGDSTTAVHAPPLLRISAATDSRRSSVRPTMKTDFPSRARRRVRDNSESLCLGVAGCAFSSPRDFARNRLTL